MKLGELDDKISARLARERNSLEQIAANELRSLSEKLSAYVSAELSTAENAIRQRSEALAASLTLDINKIEDRCALLSKSMFQTWIGYAILALLLTMAAFGGCWFLTSGAQAELKSCRAELAALETQRADLSRTVEALQAKTWGISLRKERNGRFIVLPRKITPQTGWTVGKRPAIKLE